MSVVFYIEKVWLIYNVYFSFGWNFFILLYECRLFSKFGVIVSFCDLWCLKIVVDLGFVIMFW